jgi:hypothetical protein
MNIPPKPPSDSPKYSTKRQEAINLVPCLCPPPFLKTTQNFQRWQSPFLKGSLPPVFSKIKILCFRKPKILRGWLPPFLRGWKTPFLSKLKIHRGWPPPFPRGWPPPFLKKSTISEGGHPPSITTPIPYTTSHDGTSGHHPNRGPVTNNTHKQTPRPLPVTLPRISSRQRNPTTGSCCPSPSRPSHRPRRTQSIRQCHC